MLTVLLKRKRFMLIPRFNAANQIQKHKDDTTKHEHEHTRTNEHTQSYNRDMLHYESFVLTDTHTHTYTHTHNLNSPKI